VLFILIDNRIPSSLSLVLDVSTNLQKKHILKLDGYYMMIYIFRERWLIAVALCYLLIVLCVDSMEMLLETMVIKSKPSLLLTTVLKTTGKENFVV